MKIYKTLYKRVFIGLILIVLLSYIYYLKGENTSYEEKSRLDEITISKYSTRILELENEINTSREIQEATNAVAYLIESMKEDNKYITDNRKDIVDETMSQEGVWLIPQTELFDVDAYDLDGTRPYVYEYIDDSIYIYYFQKLSHLNNAMNDIEETFNKMNINDIFKYTIKDSILVLYIPNDPSYIELINDQIEKLKKALKVIDEKME